VAQLLPFYIWKCSFFEQELRELSFHYRDYHPIGMSLEVGIAYSPCMEHDVSWNDQKLPARKMQLEFVYVINNEHRYVQPIVFGVYMGERSHDIIHHPPQSRWSICQNKGHGHPFKNTFF
jgi:hypothetical protein